VRWTLIGPNFTIYQYERAERRTKYLGPAPFPDASAVRAAEAAAAAAAGARNVDVPPSHLLNMYPAERDGRISLSWKVGSNAFFAVIYVGKSAIRVYIYLRSKITGWKPKKIMTTDMSGLVAAALRYRAFHVVEALQRFYSQIMQAAGEAHEILRRGLVRLGERWRREAGPNLEDLRLFASSNRQLLQIVRLSELAEEVERLTGGHVTKQEALRIFHESCNTDGGPRAGGAGAQGV